MRTEEHGEHGVQSAKRERVLQGPGPKRKAKKGDRQDRYVRHVHTYRRETPKKRYKEKKTRGSRIHGYLCCCVLFGLPERDGIVSSVWLARPMVISIAIVFFFFASG